MSDGTEGLTALALLERRLDSLPVRLAGRAWTAWRQRSRRGSSASVRLEALRVIEGAEPAPARVLGALDYALDAGALETAVDLFERLRPHVSSLPASSVARARAHEVALLLAVGEHSRARVASESYQVELALTAQGQALLVLLGSPGEVALSDGRPNLLGMSRRITERQLTAAQLAALLRARTWWLIRFPELQLLFATALRAEPQLAVVYLNRFLRAHGIAPLTLDETCGSGNLLERLRAVDGRAVSGGPLVSVVVAAHDSAATLAYAVDSLLRQTYQDLEILIADDGSSDATLAVLQRYSAESRVRRFRSAENQGAYNLRNALAKQARGALLTFHDADDWALPTRIEQQVEYLRRERVLGCVTSLLRVRPDGSVVFFKNQRATRLSRVSLMLPRETFDAVGPFRSARVGADEELHAKIRRRFGPLAIGRLSAPLMLSLWSASSATRHLGTEALEDGYRAPSRRAYSELVFRKYSLGQVVSDAALDQRLRETDNYVEARDIVELK